MFGTFVGSLDPDKDLVQQIHNMMKKTAFSVAAAVALLFGAREAHAQTPYNSAAGLMFDSDGGSNVGLHYKTFVNETTALQAQVSFRSNWFSLGADYQYEKAIPDADGLSWYAGGGLHLGFFSASGASSTLVGLRPQVGLEYKIPTVPLGVHLDYKPYIGISGGGGFDGGGFTFGVKYVLK